MEQEELPQYRCVCTVLSLPEGERVSTYGVEMMLRDRTERFFDVSVDADKVRRLVDLLRDERVEACHFRDVVSDYVAFLATP
jgi:hypothetical protein